MPRINKLDTEEARSSWNCQTQQGREGSKLNNPPFPHLFFFLIWLLVSGQLCKVGWQCRTKGQRGREKKQGGTEVSSKLGLVSQAFFREVSDIRHQDRRRRHHCVIAPNSPSINLAQSHASRKQRSGRLSSALTPQPSALLVTCRVLIIPNLSSVINHQALLLPKAKKPHLIMCFWLCQRGSAQFWFCLGPTDSCSGVCGDGSVGGQSRAVLYHTTEKKSFLALQIVSAPSWQIAKPGALVPRGRHLWNFGPLPNLANKMQSTPGPAFGGVGARKPSAFFPFYILIPNLALFLHLALESKERGRVESKTERYLAQVNPQKEKKKKTWNNQAGEAFTCALWEFLSNPAGKLKSMQLFSHRNLHPKPINTQFCLCFLIRRHIIYLFSHCLWASGKVHQS